MLKCKKCRSENRCRSGFHNSKQRYLCKDCGCNYVEGYARTNDAFDRAKNKMIAWVTGTRDEATFKKLYAKFKHLKECKFYTDDWDGFNCLPKKRHIIGKEHTVAIERDNSNVRHHLARFTRRTKVVSKSKEMVNLSLKLWQNLTIPHIFNIFQNRFSYIFT